MSCCFSRSQSVEKPTVLIIGAGFGGLSTAKQLIQNGASEKYHILMVDSKDYFTIGGMWQFVWNSRLNMEEVKWPLKKANLPGVDLSMNCTVDQWVPDEKKVILQDGKAVQYHSVVLACGAIGDPTSIPGIENHVNICSESHVARQKKEMIELVEKAKTGNVVFCLSISVNPYKCPPAPYELVFLVDEYLRNANVRENCRVVLTCPVDWTLPPNTKPVFMKAFEEKNIVFMPNRGLEKIEDNKIIFSDGVESLDFTTLWTVWPIRTPDFVQKSGIEINPKGTVTVGDKVTNTIPNVENAYVIGDACRVPFGEKGGVPKAGEFAWHMGKSVADAINENIQPAVRTGKCTAEAGFGKGFVLTPNFSDVCNDPKNGRPRVGIEESNEGTKEKVEWANGYLKEIFGDKVEPLKLMS